MEVEDANGTPPGYRGPMEPVIQPRGRSEVTPEHTGRRVSFQYELPNGYVGEVVGTLEWYDEAAATFVVKDRRGELVRVPAKGVRHGRVVREPKR